MDNETNKQSIIFLSHHSSQKELVQHLSKYLERHGLKTWFAPRDIRSGEAWDESINNAIQNCQAVVLLFTAKADASIQVKRELALADKYKKPVFWLRLEKVEPNNLSYFLTSTQWLDWMDQRDETLERLIYDIKSISEYNIDEKEIEIQGTPFTEAKSWVNGILAFKNDREAAECAANVCFLLAEEYPDSSIILPTGRSATTMFRAMIRLAKLFDQNPFYDAHLISDTETFGVWSQHETSRTKHINEMLIEPLKRMDKSPDPDHLHLLSGVYTDSSPIENATKVLRLYPPIVHIIALSPVGEVLAYEVGTYNEAEEIIDDGPRIVEVSEHGKKYIDPNQPSKSILSIGLGSAMNSEFLLILAFDRQKASILHRLFNGPITAGIPATLLRNHPNAYIITTNKVASEAELDERLIINDLTPTEAAEWIINN